MGTRNITRIIKDGKIVVSQFGAFDGSPNIAGKAILDFLRNYENMHKLMDVLNKVRFATGEELNRFDVINNDIFHWNNLKMYVVRKLQKKGNESYKGYIEEFIKEAMNDKKFTREDILLYLLLNLETGYNILTLLTYLREELYELPIRFHNVAFDIEGIYTIDFDTKTFSYKYHDECKIWNLDELDSIDIKLN